MAVVESGAYMNQLYTILNPSSAEGLNKNQTPTHWLVGVWFLLCHYQPSNLRDITVQQHIEVVKTYGETLFNNRVNLLSRLHALAGSSDLLANIEPISFPRAVQPIIFFLDVFSL